MKEHTTEKILVHYVWWVLQRALEKELTTLYFLARDGYVLCKIAEELCNFYRLPIVCRYLYCSRAALRMPSYHLIGDEAYDLLFQKGYRTTLQDIWNRGELTEAEQALAAQDLGADHVWNKERILSPKELASVKKTMKNSAFFNECVLQKSKAAYETTIQYFRQEGLFSQEKIAVVDSGWSGSMQRSLRQLLRSAGYDGSLVGFYFGLYSTPGDLEDGEYDSFYFSPHKELARQVYFSNNVFECMLSAPHGMTVGYEDHNGVISPRCLAEPPQLLKEKIDSGIKKDLAVLHELVARNRFGDFDTSLSPAQVREFQRMMVKPSLSECAYWGDFTFCDDVTEGYALSLADKAQCKTLKCYSFFHRAIAKLKGNSWCDGPELFWVYGVISFLPKWKQWWYRSNIYLWELIRLSRK